MPGKAKTRMGRFCSRGVCLTVLAIAAVLLTLAFVAIGLSKDTTAVEPEPLETMTPVHTTPKPHIMVWVDKGTQADDKLIITTDGEDKVLDQAAHIGYPTKAGSWISYIHNQDLFLVNVDTGKTQLLHKGVPDDLLQADWEIAWSPDQTHLAYSHWTEGEWQAFLHNVEEGNQITSWNNACIDGWYDGKLSLILLSNPPDFSGSDESKIVWP